jgi:heme oxygenase (biliverdin-IX-beta and delta-forming)
MARQIVEMGERRSMLAELRGATASRHAALDHASSALRPARITRTHYTTFLRCMLAIVRPLEERIQALAGFEQLIPDAPLRRRARCLANDLQALGAPELPPLDASELPALETYAQAFGCSYVLEGSSLGGAVLARTLGPVLQLATRSGLSYWNAYGDRVGPMWLSFVTALELWAVDASACERQVVIESACATFDAFIRQISEPNSDAPDHAA